jgi:hypothetical protein
MEGFYCWEEFMRRKAKYIVLFLALSFACAIQEMKSAQPGVAGSIKPIGNALLA